MGMRSALFILLAPAIHAATSPHRMPQPPVRFEPNEGQFAAGVAYGGFAGTRGYVIRRDAALLARIGGGYAGFRFGGSGDAILLEPGGRMPGTTGYYLGREPETWRERVAHFARIRVRELYPGIDAIYHGGAGEMEYDFVVAPGADPARIRLEAEGGDGQLRLDNGDLVLPAPGGEFRQKRPVAHQIVNGSKRVVQCRYLIAGRSARIVLGPYDRERELIIDPQITYGTYLGGSQDETPSSIAVDSAGAMIVVGTADRDTFPLVPNAPRTGSPVVAFVSKISGNTLVYSAIFGGANGAVANGVAVDGAGAALVVGRTSSVDFPVKNAMQPAMGGSTDAFLLKIDAAGSVQFSTFLGGSLGDMATEVAVDATGIYAGGVTGSQDFPGAPGQRSEEAFATKINVSGTALIFSKTLRGARSVDGLAIDPAGSVYLAGWTLGILTVTPGCLQPRKGGDIEDTDAYVAKLNPAGSAWIYATYLGGRRYDSAGAVAADSAGRAYVTGGTWSSDFPVASPVDAVHKGGSTQGQGTDAFVTILNPAGTAMLASTYLGGTSDEFAFAIKLLPDGTFATAGTTLSADFPAVGAWQSAIGYSAAFLTQFAADGKSILASTLFGPTSAIGAAEGAALATDGSGSIYLTGITDSSLAAGVTPGAYDTTYNGGSRDVFAAKFGAFPPLVTVTIDSNVPGARIRVDGRIVSAPAQMRWLPGTTHVLDANDVHEAAGFINLFSSWSNGGNAVQTVTTPASATTYQADYGQLPCLFDFAPPLQSVSAAGTTVSLIVTTYPPCRWTPSTSFGWLRIEQPSQFPRTGDGSFVVTVLPNSGPARIGSVTLGSQSSTIDQFSGGSGLGVPSITAPAVGQTQTARGSVFSWTPVTGAAGYELNIRDTGSPVRIIYSGRQTGSGAASAVIDMPDGQFKFLVRACSDAAFANCGPWIERDINVLLQRPADPPAQIVVTSPTALSTNLISWTAVPGATSYEVSMLDLASNQSILLINTPIPSTIYTTPSGSYLIKVRACQAACGPAAAAPFDVVLPALPLVAPGGFVTQLQGTNQINASWNPVPGADLYRVHVIQPTAGPGGGPLTVAARQVSAPNVSLAAPSGANSVIVAACNGNGCGPFTGASVVNVTGPNPSLPAVGNPMPVVNVTGPRADIAWNRIAGDNGTNTSYRLYVGDLSTDAPALDAVTNNNFFAALLRSEGRRYDALVFATQNGQTVMGPASGFMMTGPSALAPTVSAPTHNSASKEGIKRLQWSPVTGAVRYQYYVTRVGQTAPAFTGVTPGLFVDILFPAAGGAPSTYQAIVRACPEDQARFCTADFETGWGPWSQNITGTVSFTVTP